jgi:hypothetical protein
LFFARTAASLIRKFDETAPVLTVHVNKHLTLTIGLEKDIAVTMCLILQEVLNDDSLVDRDNLVGTFA